MFIAALRTKARICKQPKYPSTKEWIEKMWCVCVYTCMCVCAHVRAQRNISHKEEKKCVICMDLATFMLSKIKSETITFLTLNTVIQ